MRRSRIFWRLYRYGVGLVVAVAAVIALLAWAQDVSGPFHDMARRLVRAYVSGPEGIAGAPDDTEAARRIGRLADVLGGGVALYGPDGARRGAAGDDPPGPLAADDALGLDGPDFAHTRDGLVVSVPLVAGQPASGYVRMRWPGAAPPGHVPLIAAAVLAVVALVFYPLARALARPLEKVADTARAIGEGDLAARTGVERRDELGALARAVDRMAERLQALVRGEKELLANVSHELRTPLSRIRVALELCEDEPDLPAIHTRLAGIAEDVAELERLVSDVLTAARLELASDDVRGSRFVLRTESVALSQLVTRAAERFAASWPQHTLRTAVAPDVPSLAADPALLGRVVANLLDNAAKYGPPSAPIELDVRRVPDGVVLEVRDRGPGVAEADLPLLFEPFFRAERSRSREAGGLGLGLTLCRRIVVAHRGSIEAALREGGGLVVRVVLPV